MSVIRMFPNQHIPTGLRNIAEGIEDGEYSGDDCTLIIGSDVFHLGCSDDAQAATDAVFNMTLGIHKLMHPVMQEISEQ